MAIPRPSTTGAGAAPSSGLKVPMLAFSGTVINLLSVAKIEKLNSAGWYVMFYTTLDGSATTDGFARSVADEATADAEIAKIKLHLARMGGMSDFADLS